jgi:hypothetical protein
VPYDLSWWLWLLTSPSFVEFVDRALIGADQPDRAADDRCKRRVEVERGIHFTQHVLQRLEIADRADQDLSAITRRWQQARSSAASLTADCPA